MLSECLICSLQECNPIARLNYRCVLTIDVAAVHMLKDRQGDILQLSSVMYLDCRTILALQVRDVYNHVCVEIHL